MSQVINEDNDRARAIELDLLEKKRIDSNIQNATYKQRSEKYFNPKVRVHQFKNGDLVLKKILGINKRAFRPTWEGPFKIAKVLPNGAYELEEIDGTPTEYLWNTTFLKKYYQ